MSMFNKVLVAEDLGSINQGVFSVLEKLGIQKVDLAQYCDDAYLKLKRAKQDDEGYELLITDLSFQADHREQELTSGEALVAKVHEEFPETKIIVYSIEDRLQTVRRLHQHYSIEAYVCKGRKGLKDLQQAIEEVYQHNLFLSESVSKALSPKNNLEIEDYDIELLKLIANGLSQVEMVSYLKSANIQPHSLSSVEKRTLRLREKFKAKNASHLVSIVKDLGII